MVVLLFLKIFPLLLGWKLGAFILAAKKVSEFQWYSLWIECDSIYVVNLFKIKLDKVLQKFPTIQFHALRYAENLMIGVIPELQITIHD